MSILSQNIERLYKFGEQIRYIHSCIANYRSAVPKLSPQDVCFSCFIVDLSCKYKFPFFLSSGESHSTNVRTLTRLLRRFCKEL